MQYGNWKTMGSPFRENGITYINCECQCLNKTLKKVDFNSLKQGKSKSCRKCNNVYDLSNSYGVLKIFKQNKVYEVLFDKDDYNLIKEYTWVIDRNYVLSTKNYRKIYLHRLLKSNDNNKVIDHINHNPLDNRKCNLRICSSFENTQNQSKPINNTSGHKGVYKDKNGNYQGYVKYNGKRFTKYFSYKKFNNPYEECCLWVEQKDKELKKEFSIYK